MILRYISIPWGQFYTVQLFSSIGWQRTNETVTAESIIFYTLWYGFFTTTQLNIMRSKHLFTTILSIDCHHNYKVVTIESINHVNWLHQKLDWCFIKIENSFCPHQTVLVAIEQNNRMARLLRHILYIRDDTIIITVPWIFTTFLYLGPTFLHCGMIFRYNTNLITVFTLWYGFSLQFLSSVPFL